MQALRNSWKTGRPLKTEYSKVILRIKEQAILDWGIVSSKKKAKTPLMERLKNYYDQVMSLPDSPKKIARGAAIGIALDFLPVPGISIPLAYLLARLLRCSPIAAVATVIVFKLMVPVFFAFDLLVGKVLCGDMPPVDVTLSDIIILGPYLETIIAYGYPFLVGSLVNAALFSLAVYFLLLKLLERRRCQHRHKKKKLINAN
ncbi:MAG: DUF2062 domain-containing protein [Peptococcaceae bacterium]|nr:DUF2062 domain-containing protein [Peptococcaceae bacterium]